MTRVVLAALLGMSLLAACERREVREEESALPPGAPTLAELRNATYHGIEGLPGPVTLRDGSWEGDPLVDGGAARPRLYYARDFHVTGDIDGDGGDDALALLGYNAGGSGELAYLAVVRRENGAADCLATGLLGDRVKVRDARIADGRVYVDVLQAGEGDAMCCPAALVTRVWQLTPDGFIEVRATPTGRLALSALGGVEWVLKWWSWEEAAPAVPEVTVSFYDNRVAGSAGCNRYLATVRGGESPGAVTVTAPIATLMACPEPAGAIEGRFLAQLAAVKRYSFSAGMLALEFERDGAPATMLFARRALPDTLR